MSKIMFKGGAIVDFGNVVIDHLKAKTTPEKVATPGFYETIPPVPGAFSALRRLDIRFNGNVTVVYNAQDYADELIRKWLEAHSFFTEVRIAPSRVIRSASGRDKTPYLGQSGVTHEGTSVVVDDRLEVLKGFMGKTAASLYLFRPQSDEIRQWSAGDLLDSIKVVNSWDDITADLSI